MSMASLGSALIARKGQARSAATPTGTGGEAGREPRVITFARRPETRKMPAKAPHIPCQASAERMRKTLRLQSGTDAELRLLAERKDVSQQYVMETALREYLARHRS